MSKLTKWFSFIAILALTPGCAQQRVLTIIVDATSCSGETQRFVEQFNQATSGDASLDGCEIAVIQISDKPRLVWAGPGYRAKELRAALKEACQPSSRPGSDIHGALLIAHEYISRPSFAKASKSVLIASDMIADPAGSKSRFRDPLTYKWPAGVAVKAYGLSAQRSAEVRAVWPSAQTYMAGERFERHHLRGGH